MSLGDRVRRDICLHPQRVSADTNEDEDICLDEHDLPETSPEQDTPAAYTRSRLGSGQRTVTQEVLMTVLDISGTGYLLTPKKHRLKKVPQAIL